MANKVFTDKNCGDIYECIENSEETGGKYFKMKITIRPGGFKPVLHYHMYQDESFNIISGRLTYVLDGKTASICAGENVTLPKAKPHTHYNNENEDLVMYQVITPSLDFDYFFDSLFGLASEGRMKNGTPGILQIMVFIRTLQSKTFLAGIPLGLQKALSFVLAPIGRLAGKKAAYKRFSGVEF